MLKPEQSKKQSQPASAGTHLAILYSIADLGHQEVDDFNDKSKKRLVQKIRLTWELPNELKEFNGEEKPMVVGATYSNSMYSLSKLRPVVEGMLGVQLRDDEAANFGMEEYKGLIGKACMLTVMHKAGRDGNTYANVATVAPLMKGLTVPAQFNESVVYEIGTSSDEDFAKLPEFIRNMILKSAEKTPKTITQVEGSSGTNYPTETINPEDIPF